MARHQPFVDRVLRAAEVVVRGAFPARELLVRGHRGQDVATGGDLDAVALQVEVDDLERVATAAGPTWPNGCHICEVELDPATGEETWRWSPVTSS